jgi:hypothetical protein
MLERLEGAVRGFVSSESMEALPLLESKCFMLDQSDSTVVTGNGTFTGPKKYGSPLLLL